MSEVEGHIFNLRGSKHYWFMCGMGKAKFVEDVCILACEIGEEDFGFLHLFPDLLDNAAGTEKLIRAYRLKSRFFDRRYINVLVIRVEPATKGHHNEAGVQI